MSNRDPQRQGDGFLRQKTYTSVPQFSFAAGLLLMAGVLASSAANITMNGTDAANTSSFNSALHWTGGLAPAAGNNYFTGANNLRVPANTTSLTFLGDSLSIDAGARFIGKTTGSGQVITVNNLILNGGNLEQATANSDNNSITFAGNINVAASSGIGALGGTANGSSTFETLILTATISGSAPLVVSGSTLNAGGNTGVVKLGAANPYSGTISVTNGFNGATAVIASTVNRILQLNNLNALSNATLNLISTIASPVSFASGANAGAFNIGALQGTSAQTLTDTAAAAITLSVGGNNASSTNSGVLSGSGSLVKTGTGTMTLSGVNTYTGNTVINAGALKLSNAGSLASGNITVAAGATFDVATQNTPVLAANQNLLGSGSVNGSLTTAATSKIVAGTDGTVGTLTFNNNLTVVSGSAFSLDVSASASSGNDNVTVAGALTLNNTTLKIQALSGAADLDTSADYILITAASISGTPNSTVTWVGTQPGNAGKFTVVASGTQVKLHYSSGTPLIAAGSATPVTLTRNQSTLLTIAVTPATGPDSTGIAVTANLTPIGGSAAEVFYDDGTHGDVTSGDGIYSFGAVVPASIAAANVTINCSVTDAQARIATPTIAVSVVNATFTWNGIAANDDWSSNLNWTSGAAPGYAGDTLTFAGTTRLTPNLGASYSVAGLNFDVSAGSFVIGSTGSTLTLAGGAVVNNSVNAQTLNVPIVNGANLVGVAGSGNTVIQGAISSTGGLSKNDNGTLTLTGTNTYSGNTDINGGTLQIAGLGSLGSGTYSGNITNKGVLQYSSSVTQTLTGVISGTGSLVSDSGTLILTGVNTYSSNTIISSGVLQIAGSGSLGGGSYAANITNAGTFQYSSTAAQTVSGVIVGTGGLVKDGSGILTLNGANAYDGATVVTAGTLVYNPSNVTYPTISSLTVSNAAVTVNANSASSLLVGSLTLAKNSTLNLSFNFSTGNPTAAAVSATTLSAGDHITIKISGLAAAVGQFSLISYAGTPLSDINNFVLGGLPPGITASLVNNVGNNSIDLNVTSEVASTWIPLAGSDGFGASSFNSGLNWLGSTAPSAANGYYTKNFFLRTPADANSYTFAGAALSIDPYDGSNGHLLLKASANGAVITINNLILNGGLVDYANAGDILMSTLDGNVTLQTGTTSYMGALGNPSLETFIVKAPVSGSGNLQIGGTNINAGNDYGTVILSGNSTYTGNTTVAMGALLVNGSVANSAVTVFTNALLGGTGSIGGPVTVALGGKLAPGSSARGALVSSLGTLTAANVTLSGTAVMKLDRSAVVNSDRLVASSVVINTGATLTVNNIGSAALAAGDTFTLFSSPISGAFTTVTLPALPGTNVYWANNLAVDGTIAVVSTVNTAVTNITTTVSGGSLSLSWPTDHTGWTLQSQTNDLSVGISTNWVDVSESKITNAVTVPLNSTNGAVFYRLKY